MPKILKFGKDEECEICIELDDGRVISLSELVVWMLKRLTEKGVIP
jgi:hypothetical protein